MFIPRFTIAIGDYRCSCPDMPADLPTCIYDRQERAIVLTVHEQYANAICLETTRQPGGAPFTALEEWLNSLSDECLASEGIPPTDHAATDLPYAGR